MTLKHVLNASLLLKRIDILSIVPQQSPLILDELDKVVRRRGRKVAWKDLSSKGIENFGSLAEELEVKHLLRLVQLEF